MIRVAIIEDVPLARQRLMRLLGDHEDVKVVAEAGSLRAAASSLDISRPDLIFLDVTLPDGEGPDLIRRLPPVRRPLVVFSTARADHAIPAFELEAIDYLLKPIFEADVARALERARRALAQRANDQRGERLVVPGRSGSEFLPVGCLEAVEARDHYLLLLTDRGERLMRGRLTDMLNKLSAGGFVRCHRSVIVRLDSIRQLEVLSSGDARLHLQSGRTVRASRTGRRLVQAALES